MNVFNYNITTK
jgi:hypothetical protein